MENHTNCAISNIVAISNIALRCDKMCIEQQAHTSHLVHTLFSILHLNNKYDLNTTFLVKLKICKCRLHYGAASFETFLKGPSNKKSLGTAGL